MQYTDVIAFKGARFLKGERRGTTVVIGSVDAGVSLLGFESQACHLLGLTL